MKMGKDVGSLKRRVGYFEEELSATRTRLNNMQVDEAEESGQRSTYTDDN